MWPGWTEGNGVESKIGTAFLGNTFSGIVDAGTSLYHNVTHGDDGPLADLVLGGTRQGIPGGGIVSKGIVGVLTDLGVNAITKAAPIASAVAPAASEVGAEGMAGPVGWAKLGIDGAVFATAVAYGTNHP